MTTANEDAEQSRGQLSLSLLELAVGVVLIIAVVSTTSGYRPDSATSSLQGAQYASDVALIVSSPHWTGTPEQLRTAITTHPNVAVWIERPHHHNDVVRIVVWTPEGKHTVAVRP